MLKQVNPVRNFNFSKSKKVISDGVKVQDITIGAGHPLVLIAGPCVIENRASCISTAKKIKELAVDLDIPFIFKSSYDKANRSSVKSYRGPGLQKGLDILREVKEKLGIPVLSDIHCRREISRAVKVLDVLQVPALLSRQTDLILEAARTGKPLNIKKGQFMAPGEVAGILEKAESCGNKNILVTERGTSFGYNNLVSDMRSLVILRSFGYPVIYDATHSVQLPGAGGKVSLGERKFVPYLCRAAAAVGIDGLFVEVHLKPHEALCDGPNMVGLNELKALLEDIKKIRNLNLRP
jgi:2-dehydro-3-deoxyphosphooctonate aldolase (KDO 8-P synthase)